MAFAVSLPNTNSAFKGSSVCFRYKARPGTSLRTLRRPRLLPRCSYAADLQTRAVDISPAETDELVASVNEALSRNVGIAREQLEDMVVHLADSRGMSRLALVEAFGSIGSSAVPILIQGLRECPNPVVRRSCGKALAKIGDSVATDTLIHTLLYDDDTVTRSSAAGALAKMGVSAVPKLIEVIAGPGNMTAKGHAAWAIAFMQGEAADALLTSAQHPNADVRLAVVSALGGVLLGDALPAMGEGAVDDWADDDGEQDARDKVKKSAQAALVKALTDSSAEVRAEAVTALANSGATDYATDVAAILNDNDPETRRAAALGLMKIGDESIVPLLRKRIDDQDEVDSVRSVAELAVRTLQRGSESADDW